MLRLIITITQNHLMRGLILVSFCMVGLVCHAQVTHKSQTMGKTAKGKTEQLNPPSAAIPLKVSPASRDSVEEVDAEKVVVVTKTAPIGVDLNYLPLFGRYLKTQDQLVQDEIFKAECDREFETRKEAGDFFNKMGWQYLKEGDKNTATYRFNLSYLLNPENYEPFWGLGVISFQTGNLSEAISLMEEGLTLSGGNNYIFMTDLATIYIKNASQYPNAVIETEKAKNLLQKAIELQPNYTTAFVQMTLVNLIENHPDEAWENLHKAFELNPAEISKEVVKELLSKKEDPRGVFKRE